jgi:membrane protein required for colicin V production
MTWFDYAALAIIALSVLIGVLRGAVREVLSVVAWVSSLLIAARFSHAVAEFLPSSWTNPTLRLILAFIGLMLGCLLLCALVTYALSQLIKKGGLTGPDRALGALFGLVRGVLILVALVLLAGMTPLPKERAWRHAVLSEPLESLAIYVRTYLPASLADRIRYG